MADTLLTVCFLAVAILFVAGLLRQPYWVDELSRGNQMLKCPWCGAKLHSTDTGLMCRSCMNYFERDKWWTVSCDENHAHGRTCLAEVEPPKEARRG